MTGFPSMTKTHFDTLDDDPQQAQAEFAANVDAFNWVAAALNAGGAGIPLLGSGGGNAPTFAQLGPAGIATSAVTQDKIAVGAVSADKLAVGAVTQDKIADDAVGLTKLGHGAANQIFATDNSGTPVLINQNTLGGKILQVQHFEHDTPGSAQAFTPITGAIHSSGVTTIRQFFITPLSATSILYIDWSTPLAASTNWAVGCIFDGDVSSGSWAVAAAITSNPSVAYPVNNVGHYIVPSTSENLRGFALNVACIGTSGTIYFNQGSSGNNFGGLLKTRIRIIEVQP